MIDIRHDCSYCEELDRIYRGWVCFPPVRNGEVSAECYVPAIRPHPHPNTFGQVDGEKGVGRVEPVLLPLHCVCILLQLRPGLALALRQQTGSS